MNQIKDLPLSLQSETFKPLASDFDSMLRQLLKGMVDTKENAGTINIKVKVTLTEDSAPDYTVAGGQQTRSITKPQFDHEVSAVIQRKDKRTGSVSGDFELVRDGNGGYVMRHIDDGQYNLFDQGKDGEIVDADYVALPEGPAALPGVSEGESKGEGEEAAEGATERFEDTPFAWLLQFVGLTLRVTEAMGNFTVRTDDNKVILSSATSPDAAFFCPAEVLKPHVGHKVKCVGYGEDEPVNIAIECEECGEVLYEIDNPRGDEEPAADALDEAPAGDEHEEAEEAAEGDGDYGYEPPAEDAAAEEEE